MLSKRMIGAWGFFALCTLIAGIVALALSFVWRAPNLLLNLTLSTTDLNFGTILGVVLISTFVFSLGAIVSRNTSTFRLYLLNWVLLGNGILILIIGTFFWVYTLHERNNYHTVFGNQSDATKVSIQDTLKCCGYFSATDELAIGGTVCTSQGAAEALNNFCVTPITKFADETLNNIFSTIYGFMAIIIGFFLANMCVIKKRQEFARFEKIDVKRGGSGFV